MTLPLFESEMGSLSDGDEQELSRVTVLVGRLLIGVGVPSRVITSAVANDVIELANDQLPARTGLETAFDNAEGRWTLARLTGAVIDPDRSLAEVGRWIDEVSSCSRSSQRACAPAVSARDARSVAIGRQGCEATKHAGDIAFCSNIAAGP